MKIDISNSELCDKYSILEIKLLNNLDVVKESSLLSKQFQELIDEHPTLKYYYEIYNLTHLISCMFYRRYWL